MRGGDRKESCHNRWDLVNGLGVSLPAGEVFSHEATQGGVSDWARARSGKERRRERDFMILTSGRRESCLNRRIVSRIRFLAVSWIQLRGHGSAVATETEELLHSYLISTHP
jgi:hypothetical protein